MSHFYTLILCLFVFVHVSNYGLCEKATADSKTSNALSPRETSVEREERDTNHHHDNHKISAENRNRGKRDSGKIPGYIEEKRLRDFVGKRSQTEAYPFNPELTQLVPLKDVSGNSELLLESTADGDEKLMHMYDFDGSNHDRKLLEQMWYPFPSQWSSSREIPEKTSYTRDSDSWVPYNKRLRDFVGKRDGDFPLEKRLRDFVGKRSDESIENQDNIKHEDVFTDDKRLRDFVGKRAVHFPLQITDDHLDLNKRLRDFVGKRSHTNNLRQKRPREFVGKREWVESNENVDKRFRDFVGKRNLYSSDVFSPSADKRLRDFVGKRGTTDIFREDKRLRDFVGKRNDKRAREFVGKRYQSGGENEDSLSAFKRLRDFVGKRSHLYNLETHFGLR